jgi:hypothetical protein
MAPTVSSIGTVGSTQAGLAGLDHVLRAAVGGVWSTRRSDVAELRGEHDFLAPPLDGAPDKLLVPPVPVDVRAVDEGDAALARAMQVRDHRARVGLAVDGGAEPDGRYLQIAQPAPRHRGHSLSLSCGA